MRQAATSRLISGVASAADGGPGGRVRGDAAQGVVDHRMAAGEGVVGQAVVLADGGEPLGERGAADGRGEAGEVIGDGLGRRWQRGPAGELAPLGKASQPAW